MSTTTSTARVEGDVAALRAPTLAWALRRAALAVVILVVAIHPTLPQNLSISLTPLETEAIVVVTLLLLGVNFAWWLLFEEALTDEAVPPG